MPNSLDTLEYAASLEAAGVPKAQAEAHARALAQATKDLHLLPRAIEVQSLKQERAEVRLDGRLDGIDARLNALEQSVAAMGKDVAQLNKDVAKLMVMMRILFAFIVPTFVAVVAHLFV